MKIALWCALCVLCIAAGHIVIGTAALLLLAGCAPIRQKRERDIERQGSDAQQHTSMHQ
jgi:hypothetical protein